MVTEKHSYRIFFIIITSVLFFSTCSNSKNQDSNFYIVGKMKDVMWKGKLGGVISLDTIKNKNGLYGLGPQEFLKGELLINNGVTYVSKVTSDSTMSVQKTNTVAAPFFVYTNIENWVKVILPNNIKTIKDLETFITGKTKHLKNPFAYKVIGKVKEAKIHVQNLPEGSSVSSPKEAHIGQTNYQVFDTDCTIIGVYSENHKGVFTHHDTNAHMHLLTNDETKMGHLDNLVIDKMNLFLPK